MQKENSYLKIYDYFKYITEKNQKLKGFAGYFQRDLDNKITSYNGITSPYLALWKYEKGYSGEKANTLAVIEVGYVILRNDVPIDDVEEAYKAIDECESIAKEINSRLQFDNYQKEHLLYNSFLKERTKIIPVDIKEVGFGVEVSIFFKNPELLTINPDDWSDIDSVCG